MRIRAWFVAMTALAALSAAAGEALACECGGPGPPCVAVFEAEVLFAGTVRSISAVPDEGPPLPPGVGRIPKSVRVEFGDVTAFRGVDAAPLSVVTAGSGPSCGYEFRQGERYLVYAYWNDERALATGLCSGTKPFAEADEDLRVLRSLNAPPDARGAPVYGTITHWERDVSTEEPRNFGPVPNVHVVVSGSGGSFEAWTDARGRYDMRVPVGQYDITVVPPRGFATHDLQRSFEVRDLRSCAPADFDVRFDGQVTGVLRHSSGAPASDVLVELMAAADIDKGAFTRTRTASTDAAGRFEFDEVSPDRYVVGVGLTRRMAPLVFPTTYHPGTSDGGSATVVHLDGGDHRELAPMTLPQPRRPLELTGTVVFQDGSPAAGVLVSVLDGTRKWRSPVGISVGSDGTFSVVVHEGLSYVIEASRWDNVQRRSMTGAVGPLVVTGDIGPLTIVLSPRR